MAGSALRTAAGLWLVVGLASGGIAEVRGKAGHHIGSKKATLCSEATDCASCFEKMECYKPPKLDPV